MQLSESPDFRNYFGPIQATTVARAIHHDSGD